jgi:hypothetical protein
MRAHALTIADPKAKAVMVDLARRYDLLADKTAKDGLPSLLMTG